MARSTSVLLFLGALSCGGGERARPDPSTQVGPGAPPATSASRSIATPPATPVAPSVADYVPQGGTCGRVSSVALTRTVDVLAGRYSMKFFEGATSGPPSWDVMSAPRPAEEATRLWLMVGGQPHVAMTFEEQFALAGPSLESASAEYARRRRAADARLVHIHAADPSLRVVGLVPPRCDLNDENAAVVIEVVIADASGEVTTAVVGVDASEIGDCGACTDRIVEALGTLTPGPRPFTSATADRPLTGSRGWQIHVPDGWSLVSQPGPDFVWHRLRKPALFPNPPATVVLYDGDPPDSTLPPDASETARRRETVAGRAGEWTLWTRPLPDVTVYGAFLATRPALPFVVHVLSTVEADRDAGVALLGSLRPSRP